MRETKVEARATGGDILEWRHLGLLNLVDKHIARGITHLDTLVIVNDSIVSICLDIAKLRLLVVLSDTIDIGAQVGNGSRSRSGIDHDKLTPVTEVVGDLNVVERQGSHRESYTRILTIEEGEGEREEGTTNRSTGTHRGSVVGCRSDHVEVTLTLLSNTSPLKVIIEPVVVILLDLKVVELNLHVADEVMHGVVDKTNRGTGLRIDGRLEADGGEPSTEEGREDVVTLTREGEASLLGTKLGGNTDITKRNRNMGEPVSLLHGGYEPSNGVRTSIKKTL